MNNSKRKILLISPVRKTIKNTLWEPYKKFMIKLFTSLKKLLGRSKKCENDLHILLPLVVMVRSLSHLSYSSRKVDSAK